MTTGEKLKALRKQHKMVLEDVADILKVGRATVLKYENGTITNIPSDKIEQLAELFNVSPAYLMGWTDDNDQTSVSAPASGSNDEIRLLIPGVSKLPHEQVERTKKAFLAMFKATYPELFEEGDDDK